MSTNGGKEIPDEVPKSSRDIERELDMLNSRIHGRFPVGENNKAADEEVYALITEVDAFLDQNEGQLESRDEFDRLLQKLDTAIAITNEPYARELRRQLIERFG